MMLQTGYMLSGPDGYDRYRDWRLDVDNMSYEVHDFLPPGIAYS